MMTPHRVTAQYSIACRVRCGYVSAVYQFDDAMSQHDKADLVRLAVRAQVAQEYDVTPLAVMVHNVGIEHE